MLLVCCCYQISCVLCLVGELCAHIFPLVVLRSTNQFLPDSLLESEAFSQAISKARSLSYTAGVADFDSVNNFSKADSDNINENSNLEQTRAAIGEAKSNLDRIVAMLQKTQS
jgi:hypothetical protein